ncbi:CsbD family protein [Metapseudomonas resinovorans]|uniref:CsbD-like domain-containing protein n=1 Tax=Metapseudomonas resinovorans NBRC 106553 TaxID=1245471 RepID=S6ACI9_METRE|nr:CsbD family protein [Pseudomonas resinovorans]BAN46462.1 hypothetical protein PCA10_07300 [Pseudomonas resinovorans NBRC 106553]
MNEDQVKGRGKQVKGQVKEAAGKLIGNKTLENKGKVQDTAGKIQKHYGDLKDDLANPD